MTPGQALRAIERLIHEMGWNEDGTKREPPEVELADELYEPVGTLPVAGDRVVKRIADSPLGVKCGVEASVVRVADGKAYTDMHVCDFADNAAPDIGLFTVGVWRVSKRKPPKRDVGADPRVGDDRRSGAAHSCVAQSGKPMTPELERRCNEALAKACGWTTTDNSCPLIWRRQDGELFQFAPQYTRDLNAMAEVRKVIAKAGKRCEYVSRIDALIGELDACVDVFIALDGVFDFINSPAEIQAQAAADVLCSTWRD
jgi:hypothetical protein